MRRYSILALVSVALGCSPSQPPTAMKPAVVRTPEVVRTGPYRVSAEWLPCDKPCLVTVDNPSDKLLIFTDRIIETSVWLTAADGQEVRMTTDPAQVDMPDHMSLQSLIFVPPQGSTTFAVYINSRACESVVAPLRVEVRIHPIEMDDLEPELRRMIRPEHLLNKSLTVAWSL